MKRLLKFTALLVSFRYCPANALDFLKTIQSSNELQEIDNFQRQKQLSENNDVLKRPCFGLNNADFLGCCSEMKILFDVMIRNGTLWMYGDSQRSPDKRTVCNEKDVPLPIIRHWHNGAEIIPHIPVRKAFGPITINDCKSYFNGTAHIMAERAANKLFHARKSFR